MYKDMYVAVSGAIAAQKRLDTLTNNLANVNTPGFKADKVVFESYLAKSAGKLDNVPLRGNNNRSDQAEFVVATERYTDFTQGPIRQTGGPLDLALKGDGYLSVMTYEGERYTRSGVLSIGPEGALVTAEGHPVLDQTNQPIYLNEGFVTIDEDGTVWFNNDEDYVQEPRLAGKLKLTEFLKPEGLVKEGDGLFRPNDPGEGFTATNTKVIQGSLEGSNVNMIRQMTGIIQNQRMAESYTKAIQTNDQMTSQLLSNLGRT